MATTARRLGLEADFFFQAGSYAEKDLRVVRFEGTESLSELFRFQLQLALEDVEADFESILGKPARLKIMGREGTRYVNGIISWFEQAGEPTRLTQYSAELVPRIWLLQHRHNSRIFQEMTVKDIIDKVLKDAKIPPDEFEFKLRKSYPAREYCVQYRESDFAFISRLMEEEGIYYWFEHTEKKHVLTMSDAYPVHVPIEGNAGLVLHEVTGEEPDFEHIYHFRYTEEVRPGEVVLRDFDFKKPSLDLTANKAADVRKELEIYDYPGEYVQPAVGKDLSEVRLQEQQTPRKVGQGRTNCRRMLPGRKFTLEKHNRAAFNQEYLITQVLHTGAQIQTFKEAAGSSKGNEYNSEFSCMPAQVQFRPARVTPRPVVHGAQTAIVTGPAGEEIYPDEHGRVKVQFHWDRDGKKDEKTSCWIRVSQNWAGPSWGAMIIPRIGHEVIVDFLEGDPDQPIITGRVYNGENRPPYPLPGAKTKSTWKSNSSKGGGGSNELRYEDSKGSEEIYLHGQKDWNIVIEHDKTQKIGHDESLDVGHDRTKHVAHDQAETVDNNKSITVGVNHTEKIGSNKDLTVGANHTEKIGANMSVTVGSNLTENVALNYSETVGVAMELTIGAAMTHTVGAALVQSVGATMSQSIGVSKSVDIGSNLTQSVGANSTESVGSDKSTEIGSNETTSVGADQTLDVGGKRSTSVGKDDSLKVGTKLTIDAGDQIVLQTGSASITMKKDGTIDIKGMKITIEGTQKIEEKAAQIKSEAQMKNEMKGAMVTVEASGINTIKGALVKIN